MRSEHRKAIEKADAQAEELSQLYAELGELRNTRNTKSSETARQLEDLRGRFKVLDRKHEAAQPEADGKAMAESKLTTAIADLNAAKLKITGYEQEAVNLTQEIKECNIALLQARNAGEGLRRQLEEMQTQNDACNNDLRRQLSQAEGKARYAEAGLDQMRSSAEKTISDEQEKHRKQQEALQRRLDEAQTEIQTKSAEADNTRAFVERTVRHQQEAWEKSYADLESKVSEHKSSLEFTSKKLSDVQNERDAIETQLTSLQVELQQHQQSDTNWQARETTNLDIIDRLRKQHDAAQKEIANLRAARNQHGQLVDEYEARENVSKGFIDELRKECDSAKSQIANLQASERQRASDDHARIARESDMQSKIEGLQTDRDATAAALSTLHAASDHRQNSNQATFKPGHQLTTDCIVPLKVSEYSAPVKQRRKADRNTNTIVTETLRNEPQLTGSRTMRTQKPVTNETLEQNISTRPSLHDETSSSGHRNERLPSTSAILENNEMLDSTINPAASVKGSDTRFFGSSVQASSTLNEAGFPQIASRSSQAFPMPLGFSGNLRVSECRSFADAPPAIPSQAPHSPGFQIYEDSQTLVSDDHFEDESIRANFTFRKPFPASNSASKRITRRTSDKSLEGRDAMLLGTQRQPDNVGNSILSQPDKTPEISKYPFGSSPEFMNPPSNKVKRQYSGSSRPGSSGRAIARPPSSPMPDPRLVARSGVANAKRGALPDSQQTQEEPPTKKRATPVATKNVRRHVTDEDPPARSSQSVKDLPRVEDMNAGRNTGKSQSSHMRSSGVTTRTTRNQAKASKGKSQKRNSGNGYH